MNSTTEVGRAHCMPGERGKTKTKPPEARHTRTLSSSDAATDYATAAAAPVMLLPGFDPREEPTLFP